MALARDRFPPPLAFLFIFTHFSCLSPLATVSLSHALNINTTPRLKPWEVNNPALGTPLCQLGRRFNLASQPAQAVAVVEGKVEHVKLVF